MDPLSVAASVITIVQLTENVKKLYDFWSSIKEAPDDIRAISTDLQLLVSVLADIAFEAQHADIDPTFEAVLEGCAAKVRALNAIVEGIEPSFASNSNFKRRWASFTVVLKSVKLKKFQESLEGLKSTLMLVQQNQDRRLSRAQHQQTLMTITNQISTLSMQHFSGSNSGRSKVLYYATDRSTSLMDQAPSTTTNPSTDMSYQSVDWMRSWAPSAIPGETENQLSMADIKAPNLPSFHGSPTPVDSFGGPSIPQTWIRRSLEKCCYSSFESFFGSLHIDTCVKSLESNDEDDYTIRQDEDRREYRTSLRVSPAMWLASLGIKYGLHIRLLRSATRGWQNSLKVFCPVPDDALIFDFCREGNLPAVRTLISKGHASIRDTDSRGYTPLHYAAMAHDPALCKFLVNAGADKTIRTYGDLRPWAGAGTALLVATESSVTSDKLTDVMDTMRLFLDCVEFSEQDDDGWSSLFRIVDQNASVSCDHEATLALFLWMLQQSAFDFRSNFIEAAYARILDQIQVHRSKDAATLLLSLGPEKAIDALDQPNGYSTLMRMIAYAERDLSDYLSFGPDLHLLGLDSFFSPYVESPTSLAMYSSAAFAHWRGCLEQLDVNIDDFIDHETEQTPLKRLGWHRDDLRRLFDLSFDPLFNARSSWFRWRMKCCDCEQDFDAIIVQPYWQYLLDKIKHGMDPHEFPEDCLEYCQDWVDETSETHEPHDNAGRLDIQDNDLGMAAIDFNSDATNTSRTSDDNCVTSAAGQPDSEDAKFDPTSWSCSYEKDDAVCMDCWVQYQETGRQRTRPGTGNTSAPDDTLSEDEYSPYLLHT